MPRSFCPVVVCLLGAAFAAATVAAGPGDSAAARAFAAEHHPELDALLDQLRQESPVAYERAVADLDRARTRLETLRESQPDRYAAAMEEWRLSSRIGLTLARMALSQDPQLDDELDGLVRQRLTIRIQQTRGEVERLEKRLERLRQTLAAYDENPEDAVRREIMTMKRTLRNGSRTTTPASPARREKP